MGYWKPLHRGCETCRKVFDDKQSPPRCVIFPDPKHQWARGKCILYDGPITVYLAGPIYVKGITAAAEWRNEAKEVLERHGYRVLDPLRGKMEGQHYAPDEIVDRDLEDVGIADILLVEMDTPDVPISGTSMEMKEAHDKGKLIILWGMANPDSPWLLKHSTYRLATLAKALHDLTKVLPAWVFNWRKEDALCDASEPSS